MMYNRKSIRLPQKDYSSIGTYSVTICTHEKRHYFGDITDKQMILNEYGNIVLTKWQEIPEHFPNIYLDQFVIMPNHIHGIICIITPKSASLSSIVGSFKSVVTRKINTINYGEKRKIWQRNFWERIIRNEKELNRIRKYIINNPKNWSTDEMNQSKF